MQFIDVRFACCNRAVAESLARALLHERLAACANIGAGMSSLYCWKGVI